VKKQSKLAEATAAILESERRRRQESGELAFDN